MSRTIGFHLGMLVTAGMLVSVNAMAQACYRSAECEGPLICVNLACVAGDEVPTTCVGDDDCGYSLACFSGYCKPSGVVCSDAAGSCSVEQNSEACHCASGEGSGSGIAVDSGGEPLPVIPDAELYQQCLDNLADSCEAEPVLSEVCTEAQLASCNHLMLKLMAIDESCEDEWEALDNVSDCGDGEITSSEEIMDGGIEEVDQPADDPSISASGAAIARQETASPWDVAECCEELQEMAEDPDEQADLEAAEAYMDCIFAVSADNCEGAMACEEQLDESYGDDPDEPASISDAEDEEWGGDGDGNGDTKLDIDAGVDDDNPAENPGDRDETGEADTQVPDRDTAADGQSGEPDNGSSGATVDQTTDGDGDAPVDEADNGVVTDDPAPNANAAGDGGCRFAPYSEKNTVITLLKSLF